MKRILTVICAAAILAAGFVTVNAAPAVNIAPVNFMVASGGAYAISISWRNPARSDIQKIEVFYEDGTPLASSAGAYSLNKAASAFNEFSINLKSDGVNGYYDNECVIFRIKITYTGGEVFAEECISAPINSTPFLEGWYVGYSGQSRQRFVVQGKEVKSGNAALRVTCNLPAALGNVYSLLYGGAAEPLTPGWYRYTFWDKAASDASGWYRYLFNDDSNIEYSDAYPTSTWTQRTKEFEMYQGVGRWYAGCLFFTWDVDAYIDDMHLYKLDRQWGNVVSEVPLADGDFEKSYIPPSAFPLNTAGISCETVFDEATLTWNAGANAGYVLIYQSNGDTWDLRRVVPAAQNTALVAGGHSDKYKLTFLTAAGVESLGYEIMGTHVPLEISDVEFTLGGQRVTALAQGTLTASLKVKNNAAGNNVRGTLIAALYNGRTLCGYETHSMNVSQSALSAPASVFSANVTVPDLSGGDYSLRVYFWDGLDTRNTVKPYTEIR